MIASSPSRPLALAAENAATNRRSSASSVSSDFNDHGMPVQPYHHHHSHASEAAVTHAHGVTIKPPASSESEPSSVSETSTLEPSTVHTATAAGNGGGGHGLRLTLQSPTAAASPGFTFEEVMSPRHQNGKRYLGGYMTHRVSMAGGFLKSWKRKYFRLRDHGLVCFKHQDDTTPLFEIHFRAQSIVVVDKANANHKGTHEDASTLASTRGKVNASLVLILKHVEIVGHQTPVSKVDVPVFLKAESETELFAWVENVRLKIEVRKRAIAQDAVHTALEETGQAVATKPQTPTRPRQGSTGESVSLSERHGSAHALEDAPKNRSPSGRDSRIASMSNLSSPLRSPSEVSPAGATPPDRSKLLFVAGSTPDPIEFATFRSKYLLMKEIGEGSFSIVHRAVNRLTGRLCAVKCCKYSPALEEEVAILRKLSHANLVGLEGVYMQDDMYYVVMDYMEDGDLCERLIQKQRLSEPEAKHIIAQVLTGLEHLHRHNVLHRDLKPENILLHGDVVKIADFGLARQLPTATSMLKRSCGTLEYAAPELLRGHAYGLKSDIFSLGVVLYVLLFGAFPFTVESAAALQRMERFPEGVDVRDMSCLQRDNVQWKQVSASARDVLLRMLCVNDKDRIPARDLLAHPWFESSASPASSGEGSLGVKRRDSSVVLHEIRADERELGRLEDCRVKGFIELLSRGLDVVKYAKSGSRAPHLSTLSLDFVHGTIAWTARGGVLGIAAGSSTRKVTDNANTSTAATSAKRGSRVISFSDVQEIRVGHTTEAFRSIATGGRDPPAADLCVSIVATWRTLDFAVKAGAQREFLVAGLNKSLADYRVKHKQP